ncbi:hypothetical protein CBM2623_B70326 [Cupriavidus taiwanensis]|nr:hypothetical protein CBM2623_B70326 [Cupriavidus taiwanensis]SPA52939.1 hypothetical protein CBM2629_B80064 [Cupriavidus taiwanensis]
MPPRIYTACQASAPQTRATMGPVPSRLARRDCAKQVLKPQYYFPPLRSYRESHGRPV